jgi:LysM repeat protein
MVTQNGNQLIRHQVVSQETLFSVARKYGLPVAKITQANPGLQTLIVGQVILVPVMAKATEKAKIAKSAPGKAPGQAPAATAKTTTSSKIPSGPALFDEQGNQVHKVDTKQTLFSIARRYGVSTADLKKWNNLPGDNVLDNQTLIVKPHAAAAKPVVAVHIPPVNPIKPESTAVLSGTPVVVARPEVVRADNTSIRRDDTIRTTASRETFSRVTENGLAELISQGGLSNKYLALHKTAPVGSFITVRNLMNNQAVSVRVIGKLPDIGANDKVVVKISKRAYQRLGALDNRFLVEVQYETVDKVLSSNN